MKKRFKTCIKEQMENVTAWHFQTLWCVADPCVARRKRSQRYSCCHFPFVVSRCAVLVIVTSPLSCCCKTSQVKQQRLPKNSPWRKIKDFLMPWKHQHPVHASLVCSMKCCCVTFAGFLPTAPVWQAGGAGEERLHRRLTRHNFIFWLTHRTGCFLGRKERWEVSEVG